MDLVHPRVDRFLDDLTAGSGPVLAEMEALAARRSFPIVGPQAGRLLYVLALAIGARRVLELGSGFGYSAMWFARAVGPTGRVVLTEGSSERAAEAATFLQRAGFGQRVHVQVGDALELARATDEVFDVVFNDVDKHDYDKVLELADARLRVGGLFVSDNMLWKGAALDPDPADAATRGVRELTRRLFASDRFAATLVPVRDGMTVAVKVA